jgi:1-deoxy-D-xylulose-5-phosphate synthase
MKNSNWKKYCIKQGSKIAVLSNGTIGNNVSLAIAKIKHPETIAHYDFPFVKPLDESALHVILKPIPLLLQLKMAL